MAQLFPSFKVINNLKVKPTEGEYHLLQFLNNTLDDTYEIYFQPWINGDNPDIVIMRKKSGVMIIEVKDWNLDHYLLDDKKNWVLNSNGAVLKSPLAQVRNYKNNLYELHINNLYKKYIRDNSMFVIVSEAVYFHNANVLKIENFLRNGFKSDKKYIKKLSYIDLIGRDSLQKNILDKILSNRWLNRNSKYFDDDLYNSFKRYLKPTDHTLEQGIVIKYNKEQQDLIDSNAKEQKIKGIAGSGKTMVLAKKAVKAHKETNDMALVLCYNIALINYLRDRISEVKENFNWGAFQINNYHEFIRQQMNNHNILMPIPDGFNDWENERREEYFNSYYSNSLLFNSVKDDIKKYSAIYIDEAQDYPLVWLKLIKDTFLEDNGTYVLFADEKQNVYDNPLETKKNDENDKKPITNVVGKWNESLKKSYRLSKKNSNLANNFQKQFFNNKYYIDIIEIEQESLFREETIKYYKLQKNSSIDDISKIILSEIKNLEIHSNDACVLSFKIENVVDIDYIIRKQSHEKTITTVENFEIKKIIEKNEKEKLEKEISRMPINTDKEKLLKQNFIKNFNQKLEKRIDRELEKVRKNKRFHFRMNPGFMKMSTIHSFKGWEINTLFLIIEKESDYLTEELIYTGLTRCRNNLIIINLGNEVYDDFFGKMEFDE